MKNYKSEVRTRWGDTDSYRQHEQKTKDYTQEKWAAVNDGLMAIFAELAACKERGVDITADETVTLISKLQAYITANYYTCTDEIFTGLGRMYIADPRFKENIDKYGEGTAEFVSEAIDSFCRRKQYD